MVLFYEPSSISSLLLQQLPAYATIWLLAFILILLASRFLLHRAFEPTEQVLQSHKDFIAAASHELKSPLAVIMANIESIQNSEIKEPQTQNSLKVIDAEDTSKGPTKKQVKSSMLILIRTRIRRRAKRRILSLSFGPKCCGNSYKMRDNYHLKRGT